MKSPSRVIRIMTWIVLGLAVVLTSLALNFPNQTAQTPETTIVGTPLTVTVTPVFEARSEVGSTDGVVLMGSVIVSIVILPILFRWKDWARNGKNRPAAHPPT